MPFTKRQAKAVLNSRGQAFIKAHDLPRAIRICEMYLRRKIYSLEDITIRKSLTTLKAAFERVQTAAVLGAPDKLDAQSQGWRKAVAAQLERELNSAVTTIAQQAYSALLQAYHAGYLGRLWAIDSALKPGVEFNKAFRAPRLPTLTDYAEPYLLELDADMVKVKRLLAAALAQGATAKQVFRDIGAVLGISRKGGGLLYRLSVHTRTGIIQQFAIGGVNATLAQLGTTKQVEGSAAPYTVVQGIMWVSSRDSRVCPTCLSQDGRIFTVRELLKIGLVDLPPEGTHDLCRCNVVPVLVKEYTQPGDVPPRQTLKEWLLDNEYNDIVMSTFLDDTFLASSQVEEPTPLR